MSAGAITSKAGPSASKDKTAKRSRKRTRNKKRTSQVEDDDDSSSSSDDSDDEEAPKPKAAPVETPKKSPKKPAPDSDSDSDSDDEGKYDGGDADAKRKRKRKRTQKKKSAEESSKAAPASAAITTSNISAPKPVTLSPDQIGPDPNTDLRLSDQAKQAIQYAQVYTKDKSQWKFNKAKQNWLLRNALSVPPSDYDAALARRQGESADAADGADAEDAEEAEEGENFVPDDFVAVVTAYLTSVMGGARQRLIESLKEAANAPAVAVAPSQPEVAGDASKATTANEQSTEAAAANGTATATTTTKSVSFGNLALETEQKQEAAEAAGLPAGTDPRAVELRRTRAKQMLEQMGEAL
ncbi:uncharacterized protein SRS1_12779 [Sporisorium reilianum f. sp. reilianum]|uniref:WKF domain-containing protein n=1 Tax=Sporisorium reilianum f. sp. reilianum TaxID=72559 RepID=A0A2N8U9S4_9BASI|nr:uncharacterized protein SRS1_12779 [Sporisorium reilianum f. sp. reilianum]